MNYHAILGLQPGATAEQIKAAYREKARKFHPDKAPPAEKAQYEEAMKAINAAYTALFDGATGQTSSGPQGSPWRQQAHEKQYREPEQERDPFGFDSGTVNSGFGYDQKMWDDLREKAEEMMRNGAWGTHARRKKVRPCPHCHGTGWTEETEPNF